MSNLPYSKIYKVKYVDNSSGTTSTLNIKSKETDNYLSQIKNIIVTVPKSNIFTISQVTSGLSYMGTYNQSGSGSARVVYNIPNATKTTRYIKVYKLLTSNKLEFLGEGTSKYQDYDSIFIHIGTKALIGSYRSWGDSWGFVIVYHPEGDYITGTYYVTFTYPNTTYTRYIIINLT